jgi:hypothetical protein
MTLQGLNDAKHWRDRAAEMRVLSGEMKDFEARTMMLKLANDYDKLADRAEDRTTQPGLARDRKPGNGPVGAAMRKVLEYEQQAAECRQKAAQM